MINWNGLKHIHVIRKLSTILGQWFGADLYFLDAKGEIMPWGPASSEKTGEIEWKSPLNRWIHSKPSSVQHLKSHFKQNCQLGSSDAAQRAWVSKGVFGFESIYTSKIFIEEDVQGYVVAYPFLSREVISTDLQKARDVAQSLDLNGLDLEKIVERCRSLNPKDADYFCQLVELVAQEVETYHSEISKREEMIQSLHNELGGRYQYNNMIGKSKKMQDVYSLLEKIKSSESTILVQGENGTGKELIAKALHYSSRRADAAFVTVNCSAFNENLLDSELFGHVKGSFTGAMKDKKGLFEAAHKGTLFLDELGDMSLTMQVKLLRVLQEGTFLPVGGTELKKVDVRVIAATNKDLKAMMEQNLFREDLYYRLNVINLVVPPLRERKEDIPLLSEYFLKKACDEKQVPLKTLSSATLEKLYNYSWPGNVRELENEIERLVVLGGAEAQIHPEHLSPRILDAKPGLESFSTPGKPGFQGTLKDALEEVEKSMILEGLKRTKWNKSRLAKELGISRAGLIMKVEKYGLDKRKLQRAS